MNRHSIRFRLNLFFTLLISAILGVFGLVSYIDSRDQLLERYEQDRQSLRKRLEINLASPMWRLDTETVKKNLQAEIITPVLSIVIAEDKNGPPIAEAHVKAANEQPELQDRLVFPLVIEAEGNTVELGLVTVVTTRAVIQQELHSLVSSRALEMFVLISLLLISMSAVLLKLVLNPLDALKNALTKAAQLKDANIKLTLPEAGLDEFGEVGKSFALIADRLAKDLASGERKEAELRQAYAKQLEMTSQVEHSKQLAEEASKAKSAFLANMSHEIRTPMNTIIGLSQLALKTELRPQTREYIDRVRLSGEHLLGIINDILDFSKIEAEKLSLENVPFEMDALLANVANLVAGKAIEKELELLFDLAAEVPQHLIGDPLRLAQVMVNFANNAVKFTEKGEISLVIRVEKHCAADAQGQERVLLRFTVNDSGIGLSPAQIDSLFQSFHQADASTSRRYGGTGLGLSISKRLAELMGGTVGVSSQVGRGSSFWFSAELGVQDASVLAAEPLKQAPSFQLLSQRMQACRVLVVDDHPYARSLMRELLLGMGAEVACADSGRAALSAVQEAQSEKKPFDLLVLDWRMPEMNGIETAQAIHALQLKPRPRLLMATAFGRDEVLQYQRSKLIDAVLIKPVYTSSLCAALQQALMEEATDLQAGANTQDANAGLLAQIYGARILLVDDNEFNQFVGAELLKSAGFRVDLANDGQMAVDKVQAQDYDAVLMDMQMPVMDGLAATRAIRALPRFAQLPIIAMTANAMQHDKEACLASGMLDVVTKPIVPADLWSTMLRWIPVREPGAAAAPQAPSASPPADHPINAGLPSEIAGMDVSFALQQAGGEPKALIEMLRLFVRNQEHLMQNLNEALLQEDYASAERLAHSCKGVSSCLGAQAVCDQAAGLEERFRSRLDLEQVPQLIDALRLELEALLQAVRAALPISAPRRAIAVDAQSLRLVGRQLLSLFENADSEALDLLNQHADLFYSANAQGFADMLAALESYDFELATRLIKERFLAEGA
ncbi:histidine kinase [Paucibacter sp. KBW04]|uniref:hybrid sensor histidine kinase/response regulator n=1 Tax=Paucibacter sp. KBW04 TaxID=2153361 RepID=UPI000F569C7A|nr:response regulator [Paucibacter sp. KBW04]RQO61779.1 histidine kinase [Paucibacter sp. KBW04]